MLLYMEIDGTLEFRRHEPHWPDLSARWLPQELMGAIPRDSKLTAQQQAERLVLQTGWVGRAPIDAKSDAGKAMRGRRAWYCPDHPDVCGLVTAGE